MKTSAGTALWADAKMRAAAMAALAIFAGCQDSGPLPLPTTRAAKPALAVQPSQPVVSAQPEQADPAESRVAQASVGSVNPLRGSAESAAEAPLSEKPALGKAPVVKPAALPTNDEPRKVEVLIKEKSFKTDPATGALRASYDDIDLLKVLNMDPVTKDAVQKMPVWLKGLNGKQVIIRGFMKPDYVETGIKRFLMVRDTGLCCFGPVTRVYDMIEVALKPGTATDYIELKPFDVMGTMRIEMKAEDDLVYGLYYLDDAKIIHKR
jgi:hypothetical protein